MFPEMTRRLSFGYGDVHLLANLCHNCGACLHACQYAPPHEFAVNVPVAMAEVRGRTWQDYAWPHPLGKLYRDNGLVVAIALALGLSLFLVMAAGMHGSLLTPPAAFDNFYGVFPHNLLVVLFAPIFLFAVVAIGIGVNRFWHGITPAAGAAPVVPEATAEATDAVMTLRYLGGGHGEGCNEKDDAFTLSRRRFHHLTFYGFLLCFAATSLGTIYHYVFGWQAPYNFPALPKLLGAIGGVALVAGTLGLGWLHLRRHPLHVDRAQQPMDLGLILLLLIIGVTGLALWIFRATPAMSLLLCLHLGPVMAFFLIMPYSKFVHGFYRSAALLRHMAEKRTPNPVVAGSD